jgi:lysozyme
VAGIDISHHNGKIDWNLVKAAGVQFVFLKATEGANFVDSEFVTNRAGAKKAKLPCGAYHFFHPKDDVAKQVDQFCKTVSRLQAGDLPPVLDIEVPLEWKGIAVAERNSRILRWLKAVEQRLGVQPIIYLNRSMARDELESNPALKKYLLWLAEYTTQPSAVVPAPWKVWTFWQYSEVGKVKGVPSPRCDLNRFSGGSADLQKLLVKTSQLPVIHRIANWLTGVFQPEL